MSPYSISRAPSPSSTSRTCSSRSTSTDSAQSYSYRSKPTRGTSQEPSYEMAQITLRQRETELCKASKELEREKAAFLLEKADLQRQKDEFAAATDKTTLEAKQKKEALLERQRKDMWEGLTILATIFLLIPALSLGASLLAAEAVGGRRMFLWAIAAAAGNGQGR